MIELMIATAILGLVLAGLLGLLNSSQRAYSRGSNTIDAQQNVRVVLDRLAKDIREAGYHPRPPDTAPATCPSALYPSGGGTDNPCWSFYPIINQSASTLTLQYDWDGDGAINTAGRVNDPLTTCATAPLCRGERVTYSLAGQNLQRQEIGVDQGAGAGTAVTIASGVTGLTFTYLKDDNTTTANRELIRSVQVQITIQLGSGGASATMVDQIRIRGR